MTLLISLRRAVENGMDDATSGLFLAMAVELAEVRQQLAHAQDLLVETAIDAGRLHAQIEHLQDELTEARAERNAWRSKAEQNRLTG